MAGSSEDMPWRSLRQPLLIPSQVGSSEIKEVVASYKDTAEVKKVQSEGFYVAGSRYVSIKADDRSLYGRKV